VHVGSRDRRRQPDARGVHGGDRFPGPEELLAPAGQVVTYEFPVAGPRGEVLQVIGAWHTPVDNVSSFGAFARLDVIPSPQHPGAVQLSASGQPGQQGRIRLRISALCELGSAPRGY